MGEGSGLQGGLLYPSMSVKARKSGKVFYSHKCKGDFFLFELDESLMDDVDRERWKEAWSVILQAAALVNIAFFDIEEVTVGVDLAMKDIDTPEGESVGVDISLMNHATMEMNTLTVAVTACKVEDKKDG